MHVGVRALHLSRHCVQEADEQIIAAITALVKENIEVLGDPTRTAADGETQSIVYFTIHPSPSSSLALSCWNVAPLSPAF